MTALAMIIGMAPMAIEPGQNSPLGRAVIGGLTFATFATLLFVPTVFSIVHRTIRSKAKADAAEPLAGLALSRLIRSAFMSSESPPPTHPKRTASFLIFVFALGLAPSASRSSGITDRARSRQEVAAWTNAQTIPTVRVVQPEHGSAEQDLILPGNVAAFNTGSLFARASGYISAWNKDIGAHVTKDEILATISAPDLDQQLEQAKAQLVQLQAAVQQAQANADLGNATDQRTSQLVAQGWQSKQQGDTDRLNAAAQAAAARSRQRRTSWRSRPR